MDLASGTAATDADYGALGLPAAEFERHIAYDIGAEGVTRGLAARFGVPAVLSRFSRLVIDPNRGLDDPTLVRMRDLDPEGPTIVYDWMPGGITPADAVEIARAFKAAGADMIDCSSGQVSARQQPTYGRMYQTPFADRIRNEAGIATIAVGAISEADHVNSIIAAGRADLCAVARPHLANPAWTLLEAAKISRRTPACRCSPSLSSATASWSTRATSSPSAVRSSAAA